MVLWPPSGHSSPAPCSSPDALSGARIRTLLWTRLWSPVDLLGKSPPDLGNTPNPVDSGPPFVHHASHAEHGEGILNRRTDQPNGTGAQAPVESGGSRTWESPQSVFGEDRNHAGPARDQRFGHRHTGVEAGRDDGMPSGGPSDHPDGAPTGTGPLPVTPPPTGDGVDRRWDRTRSARSIGSLRRRRASGRHGGPGFPREPVGELGSGTER